MLISYSKDSEVIVTILEKEHEVIQLYFIDGGRSLDEYDREEHDDGYFEINSRLRIW